MRLKLALFSLPLFTVRIRRMAVLGIIVSMTLALCVPSNAQIKTGDVPDVMMLISSGAADYDMGSVNYNSVVPDATARADVMAIAKASGWKLKALTVTTEAPSPGDAKTTAVDFTLENRAVEWGAGIVQVEPIAVAMKRFNLIQLHYLLYGTFPFRSLRDYKDKFVDIDFTDAKGAYTYVIKIKNHSFDKLNLPIIVHVDEKNPSAQSPDKRGNGRGITIWIAFLVALAAGAFVFFAANRSGRKTKGATRPGDGT